MLETKRCKPCTGTFDIDGADCLLYELRNPFNQKGDAVYYSWIGMFVGAGALGSAGVGPVPSCLLYACSGSSVAKQYEIKEHNAKTLLKVVCCLPCYSLQVQNEVMKREKLKFSFLRFKKPGAPPSPE